MKILYLLSDFPYPPTSGVRWKPFNLLNYMARHHDCYVLSFGAPDALEQATSWCQSLPRLCVLGLYPFPSGWRLRLMQIRHAIRGDPPSLARVNGRDYVGGLRHALELYGCDIVHCDSLSLAQYLPIFEHLPTVLAPNDPPSLLYQRASADNTNLFLKARFAFSWWRIAIYERKVFPRFTKLHFVSNVDSSYVMSRYPELDIETIEIAVDGGFLEIPMDEQTGMQDVRPVLFSSGVLSSEGIALPLIDFLRNDFGRIRDRVPGIEYVVIGRYSPPHISAFLKDQPGVTFLPWVENYVSSLSKATIAIFLDRVGTGIKNRVLQALAAGKATVGTSTAFEGLAVQDGVHALVCDVPGSARKAVLNLLEDPSLRQHLGEAARELVKQHYTQEATGKRWEALYDSAIAKSSRAHKSTKPL